MEILVSPSCDKSTLQISMLFFLIGKETEAQKASVITQFQSLYHRRMFVSPSQPNLYFEDLIPNVMV